jgi:hypothetical protein
MKFYYKLHKSGSDILLAVSDMDLVGKSFSDGEVVFSVTSEFYGNSVASEKEIISFVKNAVMVNAVGKNIVSFLKDNELIAENGAKIICGLPHAQIFVI